MGDLLWFPSIQTKRPIEVVLTVNFKAIRFRSRRKGLGMMILAMGDIIDILPLHEDGGPPAPRTKWPKLVRSIPKERTIRKKDCNIILLNQDKPTQ